MTAKKKKKEEIMNEKQNDIKKERSVVKINERTKRDKDRKKEIKSNAEKERKE